jgi:HEAT repeat protein
MPLIKASIQEDEDKTGAAPAIDLARIQTDLSSDDVDARRAAVRQAGRVGAADILARHLALETHKAIRETILTTLIRIGGDKAVLPLLDLLRGEDAALRNDVIETLQCMGEGVIPEIEALLDDPDPDVRIFVVNILLSLRGKSVPDIALRVIARDPEVNVCAAALDVLAEVGRAEMADALRALPARFPDQPFLAFAVRSTLKRLG